MGTIAHVSKLTTPASPNHPIHTASGIPPSPDTTLPHKPTRFVAQSHKRGHADRCEALVAAVHEALEQGGEVWEQASGLLVEL